MPQALLHALKYDGWPVVAQALGARMSALGPPDVPDGRQGVLVPVPMSAARRRGRGFNQCERLARVVAAAWRWPVREDLIARVRDAPPQARLHAAQRRTNIQGCFAPCDGARARGLHPVLVDDVLTTGATLVECASALLGAGADSTSFLTFGRARTPGER